MDYSWPDSCREVTGRGRITKKDPQYLEVKKHYEASKIQAMLRIVTETTALLARCIRPKSNAAASKG